MKLSEYARRNNVTYRTAFNHWKKGYITGKQLESGTIVVQDDPVHYKENLGAILYARVSSAENKSNLETQLDGLRSYASVKGYKIIKEVKEIGSGLNDHRKLLEKILQDDNWSILLIEYENKFAEFGTHYFNILLTKLNKKIEVINASK